MTQSRGYAAHFLTGACLLALLTGCATPTNPGPQSYTVSGLVHETAPTAKDVVPGAILTVHGGVHDGETTTTDASGQFTFHAIDGQITVAVSKAGYESTSTEVAPIIGHLLEVTGTPDEICDEFSSW